VRDMYIPVYTNIYIHTYMLVVRGRLGGESEKRWIAQLCERYVCTYIHIHIYTHINIRTCTYGVALVSRLDKL